MGLSFHDEPSFVEAVGTWRLVDDDSNSIRKKRSISEDWTLDIGPHELNATPELEMITFKGKGRDDDFDGSDDIQMVNTS
jgi:hypothetical protein